MVLLYGGSYLFWIDFLCPRIEYLSGYETSDSINFGNAKCQVCNSVIGICCYLAQKWHKILLQGFIDIQSNKVQWRYCVKAGFVTKNEKSEVKERVLNSSRFYQFKHYEYMSRCNFVKNELYSSLAGKDRPRVGGGGKYFGTMCV